MGQVEQVPEQEVCLTQVYDDWLKVYPAMQL